MFSLAFQKQTSGRSQNFYRRAMPAKPDKIRSTCAFTVHSMKLATTTPDAFQVEWKRSEHKGVSERVFPGSDGMIVFEKQFRCPITIYYDKRKDEVRPKDLAFSFLVHRGGKPKTFGKLLVNVSKYWKVDRPVTENLTVDSARNNPATACISFSTQPSLGPDGSPVLAGDDMTSIAEAEQLIADKNEDWDVSEAGGEESRAKLEGFLSRRKEANEQRVSLSGLTRSEGTAGPSRRDRRSGSQMGTAPLLASFLGQTGGGRSAARPARTLRSAHGKSTAAAASEKPPEIAAEPEPEAAPADNAPLSQSPEAVAKLVADAMSWKWARSPLRAGAMPPPVGVILAIFERMELFNPAKFELIVYQSIVSDFMRTFRADTMVMDFTLFDVFLVFLYLLKCVKDPKIEATRSQYFADELVPLVRTNLDEWISGFLRELLSFGESILDTIVDGELAAPQLWDKVRSIFRPYSLPPAFEQLCQQRLIAMFDARLVSMITDENNRATFGHAGEWNAVITILRNDTRSGRILVLDLLREAAAVLMMGPALCAEPALAKELVPNIPPAIVLRLLASEKPDDLNPMTNDVAAFAKFYQLNPSETPPPIAVSHTFDLEPLLDAISGDWKTARVDSGPAAHFDFLGSFLVIQ
jgi:hypothetical protein